MKNRIISISLAVMLTLSVGLVGCAGEEVPEITKYTLTISSTEGGSVIDPGEGTFVYNEGTVVNLVAQAEQGYQFVNWTGDVSTVANVNAARTSITLNGDYAITANFVRVYSLTITSTAGGLVTLPGQGTFTYSPGRVVNLVARPASGYHFVKWEATAGTFGNATAAQTTFVMPAQDATVTANFALDLYFRVDAYLALHGPVTLPLEQRNPCVILGIMTNIVVHSVRVDLPDGRSVTIPAYTDVFSPQVDWTTLFRFLTCIPGMPVGGGEYVFTGLDAAGKPIPGARNTDIWAGVQPPAPPTNVRAELTEHGILVSWDESPIVPGSFEPSAIPQLGYYQLGIYNIETGESVYGACCISASPHLVPRNKANFAGKDRGLSLSELEDGTYCLTSCVHSVAPAGSLGKGFEYNNSDPSQDIVFTIQDGRIILRRREA